MNSPSTNYAHTATVRQKAMEPPERFSPLFNDAFLKIFGSADSAPVTQPLVNAILRAVGIPEIERVERIVADAALPGGIECKTPRLDVVMFADDGRLVDLEAQRHKVDVGSKSLFYAAKLLVENTPKSRTDKYADIPQVVVIVLLDGQTLLPDEPQFLTVGGMRWSLEGGRSAEGPDHITLVVAELDKVRARYNNVETIDDVLADESLAWLYLLAVGYENPQEVARMSENISSMEEFAQRYGIAIDDPDLKRKYDVWWQAEMEYNSAMYYAQQEGRETGLREGHEEGLREGREAGLREGREAGMREGREAGLRVGREEGLREGLEEGLREGADQERQRIINDLRSAGLDDAADLLASSSK